MRNRYADFEHIAPTAGDILSRPKFPFVHRGVYLGNGHVLHNTPAHGEHVSDIATFAQTHQVSVERISGHKKAEIRHRAFQTIIRPAPYNAVKNNCDHTVTRITEGIPTSQQLLFTILVLLGIASAALVLRK